MLIKVNRFDLAKINDKRLGSANRLATHIRDRCSFLTQVWGLAKRTYSSEVGQATNDCLLVTVTKNETFWFKKKKRRSRWPKKQSLYVSTVHL